MFSKKGLSPKQLICILSLCIICLLTGWLLFLPSIETSSPSHYDIQAELSGALLRLHIIANSDSQADQEVKLQIRDAIIEAFQDEFSSAPDKETASAMALSLLPEAERIANQVLSENGFTETASASLTNCYFPEKTYADMTFPAGYYDALRITIGAAQGQNWWCVLYPPLCFTDVSTAAMPESSQALLQNTLSPAAYQSLTPENTENSSKPVIRFRIFTFLNDLF